MQGLEWGGGGEGGRGFTSKGWKVEGEKEKSRGYQYGFLVLQVTLEEVGHMSLKGFSDTPIENCVSECSCGLGNLSFGISPQQTVYCTLFFVLPSSIYLWCGGGGVLLLCAVSGGLQNGCSECWTLCTIM